MSKTDDAVGAKSRKPKQRGQFFIVDVPTFVAVCELGDVDAAAAYLILAAGTGPDNRTTTWSREAINQRTGLNWRKADTAIAKLVQGGFAQWLTPSGAPRPRLALPLLETRQPLPPRLMKLAERIANGDDLKSAQDLRDATLGGELGWFGQNDGRWFLRSERPMVKAYLPKSLAGDETGKAMAGRSTIDNVRKARDPMALQLLVELYAKQDLAEHGGVDRQALRTKFKSVKAYATGKYQIWRFEQSRQIVSLHEGLYLHERQLTKADIEMGLNRAQDLFERVRILEDAGALEWVYYLAEDDSDTSTHIYPVAVVRHGKIVLNELESIVGSFATRAASALYANDAIARKWEDEMPGSFILPAERMLREAALVGVPRLRHRAKTSNAGRWRADLEQVAAETIAEFEAVIAERMPSLLADPEQRLADFNEASILFQR
ncbi:hypothetical protein NSE01_36820 [Novosphingobium sediminis]|uniref:Uncharacterized protein n=1 Tax=Novosphingobium sediminis TaxID=707214 RepID=A0A512AQ87_9SPHN|nr:hypothetical protein [Novosphingobium sediminis]GEO01850.1 hypothetical protein NSE01_36820 [Novosphingobium sediminis]